MTHTAAASRPGAHEPLDYDRLYEEYWGSLVNHLRSFSAGASGLELWVPDEDPWLSLISLLDAARCAGWEQVHLSLGPTTLAGLGERIHALPELLARFGQGSVEASEAGLVLHVEAFAPSEPASAEPRSAERSRSTPAHAAIAALVSPHAAERTTPNDANRSANAATQSLPTRAASELYRPALERAAAAPQHRDALRLGPGAVLAVGEAGSALLRLAVDPGSARIEAAAFETQRAELVGLLESLAALLVGLPLLEAENHATLLLEQRLRGDAPPPLAGILIPEAAHPLFGLAQDLLRSALADYRRRGALAAQHSRHDPAPGARWQGWSHAERVTAIEAQLPQILAALQVEPGALRAGVAAIRDGVRVELWLEGEAPATEKARLLMALERGLRARVEPRLEVFASEQRDKNKLRRLTVVEGASEKPAQQAREEAPEEP